MWGQDIYVICRLGGPYSEKLWPRSWKCCPRPQAEGSIFKTEVTVFHYTDRPKPVNNLFIFFLSLSNDFVYSREKTHASVTVTVVRDRKIRTALRTNQIAEFVTVTAWKKIRLDIGQCWWTETEARSINLIPSPPPLNYSRSIFRIFLSGDQQDQQTSVNHSSGIEK